MAHCDEYVELISAGLDGALTPEEAARLDAHLQVCPACRTLKTELETVRAALLDLPTAEPPAGLTQRIMDAVAADNVVPFAPPVKKKSRSHWQKWAAAAAVFAVMIAGYGAMKDPGKGSVLPQADSPTPSAETIISNGLSDSQSKARSMDASEETAAIQPFSAEEEPAIEIADAPPIVSQPPVQSAPSPQPADPPPLKTAPVYDPEPTPEPQPTMMVRSFMTTSAPPPASQEPQEIPDLASEKEEPALETGEEPDAALFVTSVKGATSETTDAEEPAEPSKAVMTPREALDVVMEARYVPEEAVLVETEEFLGWQTPYQEVGEPTGDSNAQQVSLQLQYISLSDNEKYYEFRLFSSFIDSPGDTERPSVLNHYAVPLDGGEILTERQEAEDSLQDEAAWDAYQAGIDAYHDALAN